MMQIIIDKLGATGGISPLVYLLVFLGGVISALSPCFMPILTMFGGYIGGYTTDSTRQPLRMTLAFTLGQALTLAGIGIVAVIVGKSILAVFTDYELNRYIPAGIGIVMGLHLLGVLRFRFPMIGRIRATPPDNLWSACALGVPFGLVITPCTIPIFLVIVSYLAVQANIIHGALLMIVYGIGRGTILMVVAYSAGTLKMLHNGKFIHAAERVSGVIMLAASLYLLFFSPFTNTSMAGM